MSQWRSGYAFRSTLGIRIVFEPWVRIVLWGNFLFIKLTTMYKNELTITSLARGDPIT